MSINNNLCKFLEWDSTFFQRRIGSALVEEVNEKSLQEILSWTANNNIDCLYFLADIRDHSTSYLIEKADFHLTDIKIIYEKNLEQITPQITPENILIRSAEEKDLNALKAIAAVNHRDSRFYYDGNFSQEKCDELFAVWIEKSYEGFADIVFVFEEQGQAEGYITCSVDAEHTGSIGLVGLSSKMRGKRIGNHLIQTAINWFKSQNAERVTVVTQGRNTAAQRLYQKNGFVTESVKVWYHYWSKK